MSRSSSGQIAAFCFLVMAVIVAVSCAGCAAPAPLPQPTPQVVRVEVPGPQPTPQVITNIIEVTPAVCVEAVNGLAEALGAENDMLQRYDAGKKPTAAQWERLLATDPEAIGIAMRACLAKTGVGS